MADSLDGDGHVHGQDSQQGQLDSCTQGAQEKHEDAIGAIEQAVAACGWVAAGYVQADECHRQRHQRGGDGHSPWGKAGKRQRKEYDTFGEFVGCGVALCRASFVFVVLIRRASQATVEVIKEAVNHEKDQSGGETPLYEKEPTQNGGQDGSEVGVNWFQADPREAAVESGEYRIACSDNYGTEHVSSSLYAA